ncbi:uncharacterized protein F5147DRAFT_684569 [Suillus discolor]|uniref:Secreted protein n=1 Tax=Suillus discolor TaxID=1912936 RepID=A0A9P7FBD9_9AGAM|nr:uncharacterized protein F5147DRAFT_684569 [Suillus discolor]KAG2112301.1 hypothetical protein F5147DRAFT_684569 [Suillus discolor]
MLRVPSVGCLVLILVRSTSVLYSTFKVMHSPFEYYTKSTVVLTCASLNDLTVMASLTLFEFTGRVRQGENR